MAIRYVFNPLTSQLDAINADTSAAGGTSTSVTNFNSILSATDTSVQLALDTIDNVAAKKAASSTDNALVRFDGATGQLIQNSSATINDGGILTSSGGFTSASTYGQIIATPTPNASWTAGNTVWQSGVNATNDSIGIYTNWGVPAGYAFSFCQGGTSILNSSSTGAWTFGPAVATNFSGQVHKISGQLTVATPTSPNTHESGYFMISSNLRANTYGNRYSTVLAGAGIVLDSPNANTEVCLFRANAINDSLTADAPIVGSYTALGAWTLGNPTTVTASHTVNGKTDGSVPTLDVVGNGTAGAYMRMTENGVKAYCFGIDNGGTTFRLRADDASGPIFMSCTIAGQFNFGSIVNAISHRFDTYGTAGSVLEVNNQQAGSSAYVGFLSAGITKGGVGADSTHSTKFTNAGFGALTGYCTQAGAWTFPINTTHTFGANGVTGGTTLFLKSNTGNGSILKFSDGVNGTQGIGHFDTTAQLQFSGDGNTVHGKLTAAGAWTFPKGGHTLGSSVAATSGSTIYANAADQDAVLIRNHYSVADHSFGVSIAGGTTSNDRCVQFLKNDGVTRIGLCNGAGAWTFGPAVAANFSGQVHKISGQLAVATPTSPDTPESGYFAISSNLRAGTYGNRYSTVLAGAGIVLDSPNANTEVCLFRANAINDSLTADAPIVGSYTALGAWTFGPAVAAATTGVEHIIRTGDQGDTVTYAHGEIHFSNGSSSTALPMITSMTTDASPGLILSARTGDTNVNGDMRFAVSGVSGGAHGLTTNNAFVWFGGAAVIASATRIGNWSNVAGGSWGTISDRRLKDNITPLSGALDLLLKLKPCNYTWREDYPEDIRPTTHFIADEVESVYPRWVSNSGRKEITVDGEPVVLEDVLQVNLDASFNAYLVGAIQEQQAQIDELKALVNALLAR